MAKSSSTLISAINQKVGIAVVAWNNETIISDCLKSIQQQTYPEIKTIVLDNNSADDTVNLIEKDFPWVELIKSSENTGFANGNNLIIKEFLKDETIGYVVLLNSDATLDPKWVEELVKFAQGKERIAFLQGLTLDYYNHDVIDSTHIYINRKGQGRQAGYRQPRASAPTSAQKVFGTNAAACMITRQFLEQQPFDYLFDEDFFMYLEDVDVAARAVALGWDNYFVPNAIAYHMGSASSSKNPGFSVYLVNRNLLPVLMKNLRVSIIIRTLPGLFVGDVQELYRVVRGRNYKVAYRYIAGRTRGLIQLPKYLGRSFALHRHMKSRSKDIWELMKDGTISQ